MKQNGEAQFRIGCALVMALLSLLTVTLLLVLPKPGGASTVGVVFGLVISGVVIARTITFLRGDYVGVTWVRRTSRFLYAVVGVVTVLAVLTQFIELRVGFAYYPVVAGIFVGSIFRDKPQPSDSHGPRTPTQRTMIVAASVFCAAALGATVWTVQVIPANTADPLVNVLILTSIVLWAGGLLALMRADGLYWAPRRAQARL